MLGLEPAAQLRIGLHPGQDPFEKGSNVEPGASREEDGPPSRVDPRRSFARLPLVAARAVLHVRVHDVEQVVGYPSPHIAIGLGGSDIETAIDLDRVCVDDLAREALGELDRALALARGGRPRHYDDGRAALRLGRHDEQE
jgi:hypothetical protein